MYRMLIVDDERIIREELPTALNFKELGFEIVGLAKDGEEAVSMFRELKPDAVLLDIKMPKMSGLEVLEIIKKESESTQVVLLSAYSDFSFVKKGIRQGAFDYILKIDFDEEAEAVFEKLKTKLDEGRKLNEDYQNLLFEKNSNMLFEFLAGTENELFKTETNKKLYSVIAISPIKKHSLLQLIKTKLPYMYGYDGEFGVFIVWTTNVDKKRFNVELGSFIGHIEDVIDEFKEVRIGVGQIGEGSISCPFSFKEAQKALDYAKYSNNKVFYYKDFLKKQKNDRKSFKSEDLSSFLLSEDFEEVLKIVDNEFKQYFEYSQMLSDMVLEATDIILFYKRFMRRYNIRNEIKFEQMVMEFKRIRSIYILELKLKKSLNCFHEQIKKKRKDQTDIVMEDVKSYIDVHCLEPIRLEDVAKIFYINPSYLSTKFKAYVDMSFSQYIIKKRMDQAKRLLTETNMKIYEIASTVGYSDVKHFGKLFSRDVGETARSYRKKNNKE